MSETTDKIIDKIIDNTTSRLKIPIVSTYIIVLIVHNWDLVYYLLFQSGEATTKIAYIKKNFSNYWERIFDALFFAIIILVLFTVIDLILSIGLQRVYIHKKKITDMINDYKSFEEMNVALSLQTNEVAGLREHLTKEKEKNNQHLKSIQDLKSIIEQNTQTIRYLELDKSIIKEDSKFGDLIGRIFLLHSDKEFILEIFIRILNILDLHLKESKNITYKKIYSNFVEADSLEIASSIIQILYDTKHLEKIPTEEYILLINKDKIEEITPYFL